MRVAIYTCGDAYCGRLVWLADAQEQDAPPLDRNNPDLSLRSRPLLGLEILAGLRYRGEGTWDGGRMYAPQRGRTVDVSFTHVNDLTLKVRASKFIFRKTILWTRVPSGYVQ